MSDRRANSPVFTIRMGLLLSFALVVALTCGGILIASYLGTHRLVQSVSRSLLRSTTQEVEQRLRGLFSPIEWAVLEKRTAIELGAFSAGVDADRAELIPALFSLPHVGSVMVGDENGYQLLVMRYDEAAYRAPLLNARQIGLPAPAADAHRLFTREFRAEEWGTRARWILLQDDLRSPDRVWETAIQDYDPRQRPWYRSAIGLFRGQAPILRSQDDRTVAWTKVYTMLTTRGPGMSASIAALDPDGHVKVVAFDLLLDVISKITTQYRPTRNGMLFVLSSGDKVLGPPHGSEASATVLSGDALDVERFWHTQMEGREGVFRCSLPSGDWWAGFHPFRVGNDEVFWICVAIPETDLVPEARDSRLLLGCASLFSLVLAAYLALKLSRAFATPIKALAKQGKRIAALDLEADGPDKAGFVELHELAHTLDEMRDALGVHITQLEKARHDLSERERQVRTLIESPIGGILVCRGHEIRFANHTAAAYFGFADPGAMQGLDLMNHIAPDDREDIKRRLQETMVGAQFHPHTGWRLLRKDGKLAWMQSVLTQITWEGQSSVQVFLSDVTELRAAGERQAQLQEQLRQSQKLEAIGLLAGGVAHDLNNLLQVVGGNAALARDEAFPENERMHFLLEIEKAVGNATRMIRQLLAFSRRQTLQKSVVELNALVRANLELSRRLFPVDIRFEFEPWREPLPVHGDDSQLEQVVLNLCLNARDAQPQGGYIRLRLRRLDLDEENARRLCAHGAGPFALLSIQDQGCGMPPEVLAHLFEPFFTTKPKGKGTGLGLSVVYGIVKQHQGGIEVHSEPGRGTRFDVYLPLHQGQVKKQIGRGPAPELSPCQGTVLLAEDNDQVRYMGVLALRNAGFSVIEARDGQEAVEVFTNRRQEIDVLFFDVVMPRVNGFEAARRCRDLDPEIPLLFASGYVSTDAGAEGHPPPGVRLLNKPYKIEELIGELQRLVRRR